MTKKRPLFQSELLLSLALLSVTQISHAIPEKDKKHLNPATVKESKKPRWLLKDFLAMTSQDPQRLLNLGEKLFSDERLRISSLEPSMAFEWQHRLAMVTALSEFFDPQAVKKNSSSIKFQIQSRKIIQRALLEDPSLLVRDGAVESLRRMFKMSRKEAANWKTPLESAFLSDKNIMDGEGFFIRETILTAMREGGLTPSRTISIAAVKDRNQEVRALIPATKKFKSAKVSKKRH